MSTSENRSFDDSRQGLCREWAKKLKNGLSLPHIIVDQAEAAATGDFIKLLHHVHEWLTQRKENKGEFNLPPNGWEDRIKHHFGNIPQRAKIAAQETYPGDLHGQWRNLVLTTLKKAIASDKPILPSGMAMSESCLQYTEGGEIKNKMPAAREKNVWKYDKLPVDVMDTKEFQLCKNKLQKYFVLQLHGGKLCGKTVLLHKLLDQKATTKSLVIFQINCKKTESVVLEELQCLLTQLQDANLITQEELQNLFNDDRKKIYVKKLIQLMHEKGISAIFGFDNASDNDKPLIREMTEAILELEQKSAQIQCIVVAGDRQYLYNENEIYGRGKFVLHRVTGFTEQEAYNYLKDIKTTPVLCYRYIADDALTANSSLFTEEGANYVINHFNCRPGYLLLAMTYCKTRKITFQQFANSMKQEKSKIYLRSFSGISSAADEIDEAGNQVIHKLSETHQLCQSIMKVLYFVHHENIPFLYIGKICQQIRKDAKDLKPKENYERNKLEASEVVYRLQELFQFEDRQPLNYPNGAITIEDHLFDAIWKENEKKEMSSYFVIALEAIASMISKDNTERSSDIKLAYLRPHFNKLTEKFPEYLDVTGNTDKMDENNFKMIMLTCRIRELLGQALIQGRIHTDISAALEVLLSAASSILNIVVAFSKNRFLWFNRNSSVNLEKQISAEKHAKELAKPCMDAGSNVKAEYLENYMKVSFVFNKMNLEHFILNSMKTLKISRKEASADLKSVEEMIAHKLPCDDAILKSLRKTANLLEQKELRQIFFVERLASILHTYGRQVLYVQDKMSLEQQELCEYYTQVTHHLCKAVREKTQSNIGIIYEYIAIANAVVPRLLQNRPGENVESRNQRLKEAHRQSKDLLEVRGPFYEHCTFRRVEGTAYTNLNAYKYIVKANTKLLKHLTPNDLPPTAYEECKKLQKLAEENSSLDMASHCMIQAAKFFSACGYFTDAFVTYKMAFHSDSNNMADLRDWRPNSFAWAVNNYAMAVNECIKCKDSRPAEIARAITRCKQALDLEGVSFEWRGRMQKWLNLFLEK
ncbi:uncharacterized protein LOC143451870 [Clavelina lepadiformis]|uniref:uncharacterized protein LOC143451870 n=1 Tax=Clavelina lepadiformis TaxID=159417 RepID=UPI004041B3BC